VSPLTDGDDHGGCRTALEIEPYFRIGGSEDLEYGLGDSPKYLIHATPSLGAFFSNFGTYLSEHQQPIRLTRGQAACGGGIPDPGSEDEAYSTEIALGGEEKRRC
jgi:hypothetical protein